MKYSMFPKTVLHGLHADASQMMLAMAYMKSKAIQMTGADTCAYFPHTNRTFYKGMYGSAWVRSEYRPGDRWVVWIESELFN